MYLPRSEKESTAKQRVPSGSQPMAKPNNTYMRHVSSHVRILLIQVDVTRDVCSCMGTVTFKLDDNKNNLSQNTIFKQRAEQQTRNGSLRHNPARLLQGIMPRKTPIELRVDAFLVCSTTRKMPRHSLAGKKLMTHLCIARRGVGRVMYT